MEHPRPTVHADLIPNSLPAQLLVTLSHVQCCVSLPHCTEGNRETPTGLGSQCDPSVSFQMEAEGRSQPSAPSEETEIRIYRTTDHAAISGCVVASPTRLPPQLSFLTCDE